MNRRGYEPDSVRVFERKFGVLDELVAEAIQNGGHDLRRALYLKFQETARIEGLSVVDGYDSFVIEARSAKSLGVEVEAGMTTFLARAVVGRRCASPVMEATPKPGTKLVSTILTYYGEEAWRWRLFSAEMSTEVIQTWRDLVVEAGYSVGDDDGVVINQIDRPAYDGQSGVYLQVIGRVLA